MVKGVIEVLLIEDNPGDVQLIQEMLGDVGEKQIILSEAPSLSEGIKHLDESSFDIVLLDLSLPDSRGIDTLDRMLAVNPFLPIVVMTGLNDDQTGIDAVGRGAQDYLVKGKVNGDLLVRSIHHAIERKRIELAEREQRTLAEALAETAAAINSSLNVEEVMEGILVNIGHVLPYDAADIMMFQSGNTLIVRGVGYADPDIEENIHPKILNVRDTPSLNRMSETLEPLVIRDVREEPEWIHEGTPGEIRKWVRSYAGAPITLEDEILGFINLNSATPGVFGGSVSDVLKAFANQAAIALHNAQLYQNLEDQNIALEREVLKATTELRWEKERVETILESSPEAILLLSTSGEIDLTNEAFNSLFGYSNGEALGQHLCSLMDTESIETGHLLLQEVLENRDTRRAELVVSSKDDHKFEAELALAPIRQNGDLSGVVIIIRDISALKYVERMKDIFVSNVSHELRTPITSLKLVHGLLKFNPEKRDVYLDRLEREINRLNTTIEDLLRLSRLDQGKVTLSLEAINLNELLDEYVQDRRLIAVHHGLTLTFDEDPDPKPVIADESLLGQALSVILTNAINYTPSGGEIRTFTQKRLVNAITWFGISVEDTGPGIQEEDLKFIFDRFYRGTASQEAGTPGTGLGLAIAKEIVDRHKGWIEVQNVENGHGTRFTIWLPALSE